MTSITGYREYHIKLYQGHKAEDLSDALKTAIGARVSGANVNRVKLAAAGDTEARHLAFINKVLNIASNLEPDVDYYETALGLVRAECISEMAEM